MCQVVKFADAGRGGGRTVRFDESEARIDGHRSWKHLGRLGITREQVRELTVMFWRW